MTADFAQFTRIIGRGPTLSRALDRAEAEAAMGMVLDGKAAPEQLGGFLLVLRQRGETAAELAGFAAAQRARMALPPAGAARPDIDWPSYADRHRQQPWYVLAALLLAGAGYKVLMHGIAGETEDCAPLRPVLAALGIAECDGLAAAAARLDRQGIAYAGLETFAPETEALFHLKPLLGVRSVANTYARDLNPLAAPLTLVGIVHTPYRPLHQEALALLGQDKAAVFKGVGGEAQRNPAKAVQVATLAGGQAGLEDWSAVDEGASYLWREEERDPARVAALWRGETSHPAAEAAIQATAAIALKALGAAGTQADALALAADLWRRRG